MDWKEVWKLPLRYDGITYAWANGSVMAIMFDDEYGEKDREDVVDIINGDLKTDFMPLFEVKGGCDIYFGDTYVFRVRGWGHLRGTLGLSEKEAAETQDGFVKYILDKLNGAAR